MLLSPLSSPRATRSLGGQGLLQVPPRRSRPPQGARRGGASPSPALLPLSSRPDSLSRPQVARAHLQSLNVRLCVPCPRRDRRGRALTLRPCSQHQAHPGPGRLPWPPRGRPVQVEPLCVFSPSFQSFLADADLSLARSQTATKRRRLLAAFPPPLSSLRVPSRFRTVACVVARSSGSAPARG